MAKKSRRQKLHFSNLTLVIILIGLTVGVILIAWKKKEMYEAKKMVVEQQSSTLQNKYPLDTENDGIYTNYQYGFTFKYPKEIFTSQAKYVDYLDTSGWAKQDWVQGNYKGNLDLSFMVGGMGDNAVSEDSCNPSLKENQSEGTKGTNYLLRLKDINSQMPCSVFYYNELDMSTEVKNIVFSYWFVWRDINNGNTTLSISLSGNNKSELERNRNLFVNIINSLKSI